MQTHANKSRDSRGVAVADRSAASKQAGNSVVMLADNSPESLQLSQLQLMADNSPQAANAARLQAMADRSPYSVAQRMLQMGTPAQRQDALEKEKIQMSAKSDFLRLEGSVDEDKSECKNRYLPPEQPVSEGLPQDIQTKSQSVHLESATQLQQNPIPIRALQMVRPEKDSEKGLIDQALQPVKGAVEGVKGLYKGAVKGVQGQIDQIEKKAKAGEKLSFLELTFLKGFYNAIWVGGYAKGFPEAAQLLRHYLGATGDSIQISSGIYQNSPAVKAEIERQKKLIGQDAQDGKLEEYGNIKSPLLSADYERLKKADNNFYLVSNSVLAIGLIITTYEVANVYDYKGFEVGYWTDLTVWGEMVKLPDGLSKYLVEIGLAAEFPYKAIWWEFWKAPKPQPNPKPSGEGGNSIEETSINESLPDL